VLPTRRHDVMRCARTARDLERRIHAALTDRGLDGVEQRVRRPALGFFSYGWMSVMRQRDHSALDAAPSASTGFPRAPLCR
jgi:hypothetical protein